MADKGLVNFIREARKRGFDDYQIREPLMKQGWPLDEIEKAFLALKPKFKHKNQVTLYLDSEVLRKVQRRADKNHFTISEQIEDIIRRSILSMCKRTPKEEKLDDKLIGLFSRKR